MNSKLTELSIKIENVSKDLINISKIIKDLKNEVNQNKFKKRKLTRKEQEKDELIHKLINAKKKSNVWKYEMSKYINITLDTNNNWLLQSSIFNEYSKFNSREDAELYYEKIINKYNIDTEYITRIGYVNDTYKQAIDGLILISSK